MRSSHLRRGAATLAACLVAVAATACGGSSATKKDVIARGNAICADAVRSVRAVAPPPAGSTSAAALSGYFQHLLPIVSKEVSQLRKLPRPSTDTALLNRYIDAVIQAGATYKQLAAAAHRNDLTSVARDLSALRANPAQSLAQRYGMNQCAAATGTASP